MGFLGGLSLLDLGKRVYAEYKNDDVPGLAAELSYRFFLALFPFAIFLAALGGVIASAVGVDDPAREALDVVGDALPEDAASVVATQVEAVVQGQSGGLLSVGFLGALWAASGGVGALMKALNRTFDVDEERMWWKKYAIRLGLTAFIGVVGLGALVVMVAGQVFAQDLADGLGAGGASRDVLPLLRLPLAILLVMVLMAFLYWSAPNVDTKIAWISPGAVLFTLVWVAASVGFAFYVANFANYNATYGALGGVVVLLIYLYVTNITILLGAELNAVVQKERERIEGPAGERTSLGREEVAGVDMRAGVHQHPQAGAPSLAARAGEVGGLMPPSERQPRLMRSLGMVAGALAVAVLLGRLGKGGQ